jgi:hypothetical protein
MTINMNLKNRMKNGLLSIATKKRVGDSSCTASETNESSCVFTSEEMFTTTSDDDDTTVASSLNGLSLHRSSGHGSVCSLLSNCESIQSCLRRSSSSTRRSHPKTKRPKVKFDPTIQWKTVESYIKYSANLWYTKEEAHHHRHDDFGRNIIQSYTATELCQICHYSKTYHMARHTSTISNQHQEKRTHQGGTAKEGRSSKPKINISTEEYQVIVQGKAKGWEGLERIFDPGNNNSNHDSGNGPAVSSSEDVVVIRTRRDIVQQIVAEYQEMMLGHQEMTYGPNRDHHHRSIDTPSWHSTSSTSTKKYDKIRKLQALSKSLTLFDRSWAVIMGSADHDASLI